jgi:ABC-type Fe3+/spermidine/putrescine transport system ATPase subunit
MNRGRIEQVGTPEEIYEHPRTQFVASFIGRTNCLPALVVDRQSVRCGGFTIAVNANGTMPAPGTGVIVSIRPQQISIASPDEADVPELHNVLHGNIVRHAYLGEARDYLVAVSGAELTLRVIASARQVFRPAESVRLMIAADSCRVIPGSL